MRLSKAYGLVGVSFHVDGGGGISGRCRDDDAEYVAGRRTDGERGCVVVTDGSRSGLRGSYDLEKPLLRAFADAGAGPVDETLREASAVVPGMSGLGVLEGDRNKGWSDSRGAGIEGKGG